MKMARLIKRFYFILYLIMPVLASAQNQADKIRTERDTAAITSDSTIHILLKPVYIIPDRKDMSAKKLRQYSQLELKVKKVYPIAKVAAIKLEEYNRVYTSFKTERERKNYVKQVEKDLFSEFEDELRVMKVSEGRILIKLLDRETGNSSFEIIKEFKGGFSAFFWQSVAKLFGHDLKAQYDPVTEDRLIEYIIIQIDMGLI
ncbi:MAG TPA: DUF4294 domain-containing protein [Prolixibacteraceae bacterium]|nr:DUF4294 domain-containing protein [Prolixibacteraceae bacterium]